MTKQLRDIIGHVSQRRKVLGSLPPSAANKVNKETSMTLDYPIWWNVWTPVRQEAGEQLR